MGFINERMAFIRTQLALPGATLVQDGHDIYTLRWQEEQESLIRGVSAHVLSQLLEAGHITESVKTFEDGSSRREFHLRDAGVT